MIYNRFVFLSADCDKPLTYSYHTRLTQKEYFIKIISKWNKMRKGNVLQVSRIVCSIESETFSLHIKNLILWKSYWKCKIYNIL